MKQPLFNFRLDATVFNVIRATAAANKESMSETARRALMAGLGLKADEARTEKRAAR